MSEETSHNFTPKKKRPPKWESAFLLALRLTGNVSKAAEAANVTRRNVYEHRAVTPDFAAAWDDALEVAADALEAEARRRAHDGVEEPVFGSLGKGQGTGEVGTIRKYSDTLLIFLLKGARPEKYREKSSGGVNLNVSAEELANMTDAQIDELARKRGLL